MVRVQFSRELTGERCPPLRIYSLIESYLGNKLAAIRLKWGAHSGTETSGNRGSGGLFPVGTMEYHFH